MNCLSAYPWATGAIVTFLLSLLIGPILNCIEDQLKGYWQELDRQKTAATTSSEQPNQQPLTGGIVRRRLPGDFIQGLVECFIYLGAFALNAGAIGAAWLALKVASKWKSWSMMRDAGISISEEEVSSRYRIFLVGTAANIIAGMSGAVVALSLGGLPLLK